MGLWQRIKNWWSGKSDSDGGASDLTARILRSWPGIDKPEEARLWLVGRAANWETVFRFLPFTCGRERIAAILKHLNTPETWATVADVFAKKAKYPDKKLGIQVGFNSSDLINDVIALGSLLWWIDHLETLTKEKEEKNG